MAVTVERSLELLVCAREGGVVPVEAAATFCGADEEWHEHAAVDRATLVPDLALVGVGEDARRRLLEQVGDGILHVDPRKEPLHPRLDEPAHERPVFVERRPSVRAVLLEGGWELCPILELAREDREGAEAEAAKRVVEVRRAHAEVRTTTAARCLLLLRLAAGAPVRGARVLALLRLGPQTPQHSGEVWRLAEDVRPKAHRPRIPEELEHGAVPEHGLVLGAAQDEPGLSRRCAAARSDAPAAVHPQVTAQDEPAVEAQEQVLPHRLHALEPAAVQSLLEPLDGRTRM